MINEELKEAEHHIFLALMKIKVKQSKCKYQNITLTFHIQCYPTLYCKVLFKYKYYIIKLSIIT